MSNRLFHMVDTVATAVARRITKLEVTVGVRSSSAAARHGRLAEVTIEAAGAIVGGLRLDHIHIQATDLGLRWSDGLEVVVGSTEVRIEVDQHDLDVWGRGLGLPARLVLRDSRLVARFGVAGVRLAQVEMDVKAVAGGLQLAPRRLTGPGVDIRTSATELAVRIPLPRLPVSPSLVDAEWRHGSGTIRFVVPALWMPVTVASLRQLRGAAQRMAPSAPEASDGLQVTASRSGWARTPRSTGLSGRDGSPAFSN